MLEHSKFVEWRQSSKDDLLWISADPGCGKSVLSKSLIDQELQNTSTHTVCYFFFKDNQEQDRLATALCALLHQLFAGQRHLLRHATAAWDNSGTKIQQEVDELWRILLAAGTDPEAHHVTCVLDALDECRQDDRRSLIQRLSKFYVESSARKPRRGHLRFLVTSRPYIDIELDFKEIPSSLPAIRLLGEKENDNIHDEIDLVIRQRVARLSKDLPLDPGTTERLLRKLLSMEHRTYLWLHLAVEDFSKTYRKSLWPEQEPIDSLPSTVEDAYERILTSVPAEQKDLVTTILCIVVGARRPLTTLEMAVALGLATSPDLKSPSEVHVKQHIRDWCGLFIFFNHSRIYLIHQTAKEFLVRTSGTGIASNSGWKHCLDLADTERTMTHICVECLLRMDPNESRVNDQRFIQHEGHNSKESRKLDIYAGPGRQNEQSQSFWTYSAEYWANHLRDADIGKNDALMTKTLRLYDTNSRRFRSWFSHFWHTFRQYQNEPTMNQIRLAAFNGHDTVLDLLFDHESFDLEASDKEDRTALIWAAELGHERVTSLLLEKGADMNVPGRYYGNALHTASYRGHESIVQLLLDKGADINAQRGPYGNALQAASSRGHESVVQLLLTRGAHINAQGGLYGKALQAASEGGHKLVVQLLLDKGADINAQGGLYGNALHAASSGGHESVVQLLLDKGADINTQGGLYGNALQAASYGGHESVVQLLLDNGADVNARSLLHGNALQAASQGGHKSIVQLLLTKGADANTESGGCSEPANKRIRLK